MREEYDFSQGVRNPYIKRSRKQITINLEESTVTYFKQLAEESGIPYQTLINLYLTDCVKKELKPEMVWSTKGA
ncbi:MAG: antitoxin [Clostridia bacterium]|nr:antitoxin [Clostridia bacterium]